MQVFSKRKPKIIINGMLVYKNGVYMVFELKKGIKRIKGNKKLEWIIFQNNKLEDFWYYKNFLPSCTFSLKKLLYTIQV